MKRRTLFLAAALSAAVAAPAARANDPGKMFMINAVTPGVVSFSGEGTAQFNNSSSTANAFSVGSASQFGVNASASATADYLVDANALLALGAGAQLQQTIGTSSSAANTMAASESAGKAANAIATQKTTEEFGQNFADYAAQRGYATASTTGGFDIITSSTKAGEYTTENQYDAKRQAASDKYTSEAFSSVTASATASSKTAEQGTGVIEGNFKTSNSSSTSIGASASMSTENEQKAAKAADSEYGTFYTEYKDKFESIAGTNKLITTEAEKLKADALGIAYDSGGAMLTETKTVANVTTEGTWNKAKEEFASNEYSRRANAASSAGNATNDSTATVTVKGVGSIATLNAAPASAFEVNVAARNRNDIMENNATANGSAGGSLNTVSMANQSNSQSASAFMQAFGADTVKLNAGLNGVLESATVNGRFNVTLDAKTNDITTGTGAGATTTTQGVEAATIALPTNGI